MDSVTQRLNREQTVEQENNALTDALLSGSIRPCANRFQLPATVRGFWALEFGAKDSRMNYFNLILRQRKGYPAEICVRFCCFCNGLRKPASICSLPILSSGYLGPWPKCFIWKLIAGKMNVLRQTKTQLQQAHERPSYSHPGRRAVVCHGALTVLPKRSRSPGLGSAVWKKASCLKSSHQQQTDDLVLQAWVII